MSGWTRDRGLWLAALLYVALSVVWAAPSSLSPWDRVPDLGDPLHLGYVMAWDAHQLIRRPWALFDSNSFYPYPRSLAFGDHLLPEALMVAPVNWLSGNAVLASNVSVLLGLTLSALFMFVLVRGVTGSWGAGLLSGLVYAFNSFTRHELLRVHVLHLEWWPLALLGLIRFVREGRARDAALFASGLLLQGLSGTYYLVYTAMIAPVWLLGALLIERRWLSRAGWRRLAVALGVAALIGVAVLWPYLIHFQSMGFEKSWAGGTDVLSYLDPPAKNLLFGGLGALARESEVPHFLGVIGILLVLAGASQVVLGRSTAQGIGWIALVTTGFGFLLSLGPAVLIGGQRVAPGPYALLYAYIRPFRGMASPERIGVLVMLGGALLAGLAANRLLSRCAERGRYLAIAGLAILLPLEHWSSSAPAAIAPTGRNVPPVYGFLAAAPTDPVIELPLYPERAKRLRSIYLYFSTYHWRPIPIGRTSFYPPAHDFLAWCLRSFPDPTSLLLLERMGLRTIVVHPRIWSEHERGERLAALDAEPRLHLLQRFDQVPDPRFSSLGLGEERVYRLVGEAPPAKTLCAPSDELPRSGWIFRTSGRKRPELARDGDRRTAWFTHIPQRPEDFFEVLLPRPDTLSAAVIELYYPHDEFPRNPVLFTSDDGESWRRLSWQDGPEERWAVLDDLLRRPRDARMVFRVPAQTIRGLSLRIGWREQEEAWPDWSIPELRLYRACR